eukprot:Partr_v1_DN26469_c0_g2_i4_m23717 putative solute carrier family 41 member
MKSHSQESISSKSSSIAILRSSADPLFTPGPLEVQESDDPFQHITTINESLQLAHYINRDLMRQSLSSLSISIVGLVAAGLLLKRMQTMEIISEVTELIILVPVLLNLKGNLDLNMSTRLATAAHLGRLDSRSPARGEILLGNLVAVQLQAVAVGFFAGLISLGMGSILHPVHNTAHESLLIVATAIWAGALTTFILGVIMCALVVIARAANINPDNTLAPIVTSVGDILALGLMLGMSMLLYQFDYSLSLILILIQVCAAPLYARFVTSSVQVRDVISNGWLSLFLSMLISIGSGILLEQFVGTFSAMALITPLINGLVGNFGAIYGSRISTAVQTDTRENHWQTMRTLMLINLPVQLLAMLCIRIFADISLSGGFYLGYMGISFLSLYLTLKFARILCQWLWRRGRNPDHDLLPLVTSFADLLSSAMLVLLFKCTADIP